MIDVQTGGLMMATAKGTATDPWALKTPPLTSAFTMHRDTIDGTDMLICTVGKTVLQYEYRCLKDLHAMLKAHGDWMELGSPTSRSPRSPVPSRRGDAHRRILSEAGTAGRRACADGSACTSRRSMEALGMAEVEHNPRNNRMRAI